MKIVASKREIKSILSSSDFMSWYDNLSEEDQCKVDDMADTEGIPFYEDASDEELNWLHDQFEIKYIKSNTYGYNAYKYFTKHGIGPGTLPKDAKLLDWRDIDDNVTAIWLDRCLTTKELKEYDIYPETSDHHKAYSKKLNSCTIAASSPNNSYQHYYAYDYKGKNRFSIHYDAVRDLWTWNPKASFDQFRASISPIKPYDDADYAWARIENGVISYFRKGKLIKKEYYFMFDDYGTDEDELYEDANDWMNDVINKACDTLIELNKNVEPVIIHNSEVMNYLEDEAENGLHEIIEELKADGFDVTDESDLLMGLCVDLGMDSTDAKYYANLILTHMNDSNVLGSVEDNDDKDDEYSVEDTNQEYHSDATSINSNKLPAVYRMVDFHPGDLVLDFGGGKFDNAVNYLKDKDVTLLVYDPYNRSVEHNNEVIKILREHGGADAAVNSNVLNVIKEPEARETVLRNIKRLTKKGAPIYITVYEGKGNGQEGPTKSGYQLNRKTADYLEEIQEVFPDATRKGKLIIAHNSGSISSSEDITAEYNIQFKRSVINKLRSLLVEKLESKYGIEFFVTDMFIEGDDMHIQVYGDNKYHGDIDIAVDYSFDIWDLLEDAFNKFQELFDSKSSSPVKSYTDVESYEDDQYIDRFDKDIDSYELIAKKDVEDTDGFSTEYAIYQIILEDGSIEYECYFGDSDIYGPWNGDGLDFESDSNDEAVDWYNSYESEDVTTSTITSARNDSKILTTEEIDAMLNDLKADLHSVIIATMTSEFGFDRKEADEYSRINIEPDPDYDGVRIEVGAELSYRGLDKLREILDKTLNLYVKDAYFDMAEPGILETYFAASDIIPDNVSSSKIVARRYDVPERPLDPPEYEEGDEVEAEATIKVPFNQVITIDRDGGWSYSDEEYNFTKTDDGKSDHYDDEYHIYLDDNVGIVEKLDEFLEEKLPVTPGTYRIQGDLTLVYDIENIMSYSNNDGYWSEEYGFNSPSYETHTDDATVYYNRSKSSLDNFKYTKIK